MTKKNLASRETGNEVRRRDFLVALSAGVLAAAGCAATEPARTAAGPRKLERRGSPTLVYDDMGGGDIAFLFLPGWCVSRKVFAEVPARIAGLHRAIALDWRGHGDSAPASGDFGQEELVRDALDVIEASGAKEVIPVALSHAGWVAIELRRRLGARIDRIVLVDWIVGEAPPRFLGALQELQGAETWQKTRDSLFAAWLEGVEDPKVKAFVPADMGRYDAAMWGRAAREITRAYAHNTSPLKALSTLDPRVKVLHLQAQQDPAVVKAERDFAQAHSWYKAQRLPARSHFPMIEAPREMADQIDRFAHSA